MIRYGAGVIRLYPRKDGRIALQWREAGKSCDSTRTTLEKARAWAKRKARELDQASGSQWVSPARMERLAALERMAGGDEGMVQILAAVERAVLVLGGCADLENAARYFVSHGPRAVAKQVSLGAAVEMLLLEYVDAPKVTFASMKNEWWKFVKGREELPLLEVTREMLEAHFRAQKWTARTRRNAITRWATFFRRARELDLWPRERPLPTEAIKRQKEADQAPEIFTPSEGKALLRLVERDCPRYLPYLWLAGWAGVRPSECLRLRWGALDAKQGLLHLSSTVVGKTARERWVPLEAELVKLLESVRGEDEEKICLSRSREELSLVARKKLGLRWPADVLRHSFITYRLQIVGDISKVAEEAGNSPNIIRQHYRRPIPPGQGVLWFRAL